MSATDRRILRTRDALRHALIELVTTFGYESLTVHQITAKAGISRTTFYLHYQDKDDLLFTGFQSIIDELKTAVSPTQMNSTADWEHVAKYADFYRVMLGKRGNAAFANYIREILADVMRDHLIRPLLNQQTPPNVDVTLMAHYLASAQLGLYIWWLESGMAIPATEIAQAGQDLAVKGLLWGIGIAGSALEPPPMAATDK